MVKEVEDYVEAVQKKFPFLTKQEINKILTFGLKQYAWANKMHADVLICYRQDNDPMTIHTGPLGWDKLKHYWRFLIKNRMRERVLFYFKKEKWDGYYYIGLREHEHQEFLKFNKNRRIKVFKNVYLTKLKKELNHHPSIKHIWKVPLVDDMGWRFFRDEFKTTQAEYIGKSQYELYHQCFLRRNGEGQTPISTEQ